MNHKQQLPDLPVWKHWSTERLLKEKATNPRAFARGFQMKPFSDSERMFPSFPSCFTSGVVVGEVARRGWPTFIGVDLAGRSRPGTVIFVLAMDPQTKRRFPIEILRGAWPAPETARKMAGVATRYPNIPAGGILVENNGYQQSLIDFIKDDPVTYKNIWFKIESFTTGQKNKADPRFGLAGLEIEFHNKAWTIPEDEFRGHPAECECGWCVWTAEMRDYPLGLADDTVMACWFAQGAIAKSGMDIGDPSAGMGLKKDFNAR